MNTAAGNIVISLHTADDQVDGVHIQSQRNLMASSVLKGKTPRQALQTIPSLFSRPSTAQCYASVSAMETALGITTSEETLAQRLALVRLETLREQVWRIFLDWPCYLNEASDHQTMDQVIQLCNRYENFLSPHRQLFEPGNKAISGGHLLSQIQSLQDRFRKLAESRIFAMPVEQWLEFQTCNSLIHWSANHDTISARLLSLVQNMDWEHSGKCPVTPMPVLEPEQLTDAMGQDHFIRKPRWNFRCHESGCITRCSSPLLKDLRREFGNGLLTRLTAQLTETAQLITQLSDIYWVQDGDYHYRQNVQVGEGSGIGQVSALHGHLVHQVSFNQGHIQHYRVLSPTEWHFHPEGVVASALASLNGQRQQIERQTHLLINSIDPYVIYQLRIRERESQQA